MRLCPAGVIFNTENPDTDYRSGTLLHLAGSVQQLLPMGRDFSASGSKASGWNR